MAMSQLFCSSCEETVGQRAKKSGAKEASSSRTMATSSLRCVMSSITRAWQRERPSSPRERLLNASGGGTGSMWLCHSA
eukprot:CAMPEP_0114565088 /NCGR_PEP_ID=MMETSP0114-20121206/14108_1 /TAXON_ID=31324 /ORGANISM="Goniomonas sp, Strain m" /LENGTH=78 /DNA_ID=CAMNT_0001751281 /DNA_START=156 /DNA_END=388 /DNA_ORIENTATION=-